jgi:hypothetical protein
MGHPANGAVRRVTVLAELNPPDQAVKAAISVEYGPVAIGEVSCICLLKGVALTTAPMLGAGAIEPQTLLNDVTFTEYRALPAKTGAVP